MAEKSSFYETNVLELDIDILLDHIVKTVPVAARRVELVFAAHDIPMPIIPEKLAF